MDLIWSKHDPHLVPTNEYYMDDFHNRNVSGNMKISDRGKNIA